MGAKTQKPDKDQGGMDQRHTLFAEAYIRLNGNGTQAAIEAGYSKRSASNAAYRLLKKDEIAKYITGRKTQLVERSVEKTNDIKEKIINELWKTYDEARVRPYADYRSAVRCLELIGGEAGMFQKIGDTNNKPVLNIQIILGGDPVKPKIIDQAPMEIAP